MPLLICTGKQWDVLVELCRDGASNETIGRRLGLKMETIRTHIKNMLQKAGFTNRTELAVAVLRGDIALAVQIPVRAL